VEENNNSQSNNTTKSYVKIIITIIIVLVLVILSYEIGRNQNTKNEKSVVKSIESRMTNTDIQNNVDEIEKDESEEHNYDGRWRGTVEYTDAQGFKSSIVHTWLIDGKKVYNLYSDSKVTNGKNEYNAQYNESTIELFTTNPYGGGVATVSSFSFRIVDNNTLTYSVTALYDANDLSYKDYTMILKKESGSTELPKSEIIKEPEIGMTKSEVEKSTWGKPMKVNKTTTKYGIHEQWVYSGNRYIYVDDGVVTGIQDY